MLKTAAIIIPLMLTCSIVQGGFSGNQFVYSAGFPSPLAFGAEHHYSKLFGGVYGTQYTAPAPVAPISARGHHPYAGVGYSTPHFVKFRSNGPGIGCEPFTTYDAVRSHHMFAFPAPVPSIYNTPAPVSISGFEVPNTVVKFGPPITTTTTTYSSSAAAAAVPVGNPFNAVASW